MTIDLTSSTVRLTNLGPGRVTVKYPVGGVDLLGLSASGEIVRSGNPRVFAQTFDPIEEGETIEVPAHLHSTPCGTGETPASYLATFDFARESGARGLVVGS